MDINFDDLKKELVIVAKGEGLHITEETAVALFKSAMKVVKLSVEKAAPALSIVANPILDMVEPKVLAVLDKIDGVDSPNY